MVQINRIKANDAAEFIKFHSSIVLQNLTGFKNFNKLNDRLGKFSCEDIGLKCFPEFENVVMILCLGHGQASVERGFRFINNYYDHSTLSAFFLAFCKIPLDSIKI